MRSVAPLRITLSVVMAIWVFDVVIPIMGLLANSGEGKPSFMSVAPVSSSPTGLFLNFILIEFVVLV